MTPGADGTDGEDSPDEAQPSGGDGADPAKGEEPPAGGGESSADGAGETPPEGEDTAAGTDADDGPAEGGTASDGPDAGRAERFGAAITRRRVTGVVGIAVFLLVVLVVLFVPSGLLALAYSSTAEFGAAPVTVPDVAVDANGYVEAGREEVVVEEAVGIAGQTRTIVTTNRRVSYERTIPVQDEAFDAATFTVLSSPAIETFGSPRNPLAGMSHEEVLREFSSELEGGYSDLRGLERVDRFEGVLAGRRTDVTQFSMLVEQGGEDVELYLYVASGRWGDDLVVAVGGHPASFAQERVSILELLAAVEHPAG